MTENEIYRPPRHLQRHGSRALDYITISTGEVAAVGDGKGVGAWPAAQVILEKGGA